MSSKAATGSMDRYAVIGQPVEHSLSPKIHQAFARQTNQTLRYDRLPAPADDFTAVAEAFFAAGGKGLNVTVPFKSVAAGWVDACDPASAAAGAVNTIALESGRFLGYNTDGVGFVTDLCENQGCSVSGKALLVLGAGGAAKGIIRPLLNLRPASLTLANRTQATARTLADEVRAAASGVAIESCGLDGALLAEGGADDGAYDVVVNATSAGLSGEGGLVRDSVARGAFCYDLLYSTQRGAPTPFCAWAARAGAGQVSDGIGMLVEQAAESFRIWRGVRPATAGVLAELRGDG